MDYSWGALKLVAPWRPWWQHSTSAKGSRRVGQPGLSSVSSAEGKKGLESHKTFSFQMKEGGSLISINRGPSADNFSIRNLANSQI